MDPASLWPGSVSHIHVRRLNVLSELSTKARWLVAHHRDLLFGRSCQLRSQCRCSPHFLGHFLLSFLVPLCPPSWARPSSFSTCTNASVPIVSNSAPCTVDDNDLTCRGSPEATACVDKPLVDEHLHGLRLIRQRFASHSASSSSSPSFSILSSLLAAISTFVSAHLSLRTRTPVSSFISKDTSSTTIFRTWHSSCAPLGPTRVLYHTHRSRPHIARILPETRHLAFPCFATASCSASSPDAKFT